jgi:hypothetical protein
MPIVPVVTGEWALSAATDGSDLGNCAAYFRTFTGDFLGVIARLYTDQKEQISTSAQVAFLADHSHPKVDREWPNWNLESSEVKLYQNGVFLSERDRRKFNTYITQISTIAGTNPEHEEDGNLADDGDNDGGGRISSMLGEGPKEITARPMELGSEFRETGGIGMSKDVMDDAALLDEPYVGRLVGTLRRTTQRLENPKLEIAEITSLAKFGVRGLVRYTMERIVAEGRVIYDAIYACEAVLNENKARLIELRDALAEQETKAEWFRKQQETIRHSNTELEETNQELDESIKKIGTQGGKVLSFGDRVGSTLPEENWMDRILPAGLQHGTSVGWARNQSVGGAEVATSSSTNPSGNRTANPDETLAALKPPPERSPGATGPSNLSGLSSPAPSNLPTIDTDTLSPRPLREIMGEGNPMTEEPVTDPREHLPDDNDNTIPVSK